MGRGISRGGCRLNKSLSSLSAGEWGYVPALLVVLFEASQQQSLQAAVVIAECSVMSDSLQPHGLQHTRLPCPSPSPGVYSNSGPLS